MEHNILSVRNRTQFREWLLLHAAEEKECWVEVKRGRAVLPAMGNRSFKIDTDIESAMKTARCWSKFRSFPPLYQRIRAYNVAFYKKRHPAMYKKALEHLISETKKGRMFGEWTDYGRLTDL